MTNEQPKPERDVWCSHSQQPSPGRASFQQIQTLWVGVSQPKLSPQLPGCTPSPASSRNAWRKGEECPSQDVSQVEVGGRVEHVWPNAYNCHTGGDSPPPNTAHIYNQSFLTLDGKCNSVCDMILSTSRECILYTHLQVFQPVPQIFPLISAPWITLKEARFPSRPLVFLGPSIIKAAWLATNSVAKDPRLLRFLMSCNSGTIKFTSLKYTIHWFFTYLHGCAHIIII